MEVDAASRGMPADRRHPGSSPARTGDVLLLAKVRAPSVPAWAVPRERISQLIAAGAGCPLTVVTGPPGAGKTMAIALWAASQDAGTVAWVNLDEYDCRPKVFWSYVIAALRQTGIALPKALLARNTGTGHEFLLRFASAMATMDRSVTLVLDDLHLLTDARLLDGLAYVLRNGGPRLRVVASSRIDPLLPLHRYRLDGQLTEIRASDLAFTIPESRLVMAHHGIALAEGSLERLIERTEGWAAGIRLAAISMAGHPDPDQFIKMFVAGDSAAASYLVDEILDSQSARTRDFLLRTSILDRVSDDLARALADDPSAPDALPGLAQSNAFVTPVGEGWYHYNSLFRAVLSLKLRRDHPGQVPELHRRAARWFQQNGSLADAVRHAGEAQDWQFAARMVVDELAILQVIDPRGNGEVLTDAFQHMPGELTWTEPPCLLVDAAVELSRGRDDLSAASLAAADRLLDRLPGDAHLPSRFAAALIRLTLAERAGRLDLATAATAESEALLAGLPDGLLSRHPDARVAVLSGRGAVQFWSGNFDSAASALRSGAAVTRTSDGETERADCVGKLALVEALSDRLSHATVLAGDLAAPAGTDSGQQPAFVSSATEVALACVHTERNELALASDRLRRADDALRARPDRLVSAVACLVAARRSLAQGRPPPRWR